MLRGGQTLRLSPQRPDPIVAATKDLCRLLTALVELDIEEHVVRILTAAWPWTRVLPTDDQIELAHDIAQAAEVSESLDAWRPLLDVIADWRRTARAWADGARPVSVEEPIEQPARRP